MKYNIILCLGIVITLASLPLASIANCQPSASIAPMCHAPGLGFVPPGGQGKI